MQYAFKTEPWPHQVKALDFLKGDSESVLWMQMGTGKTKVAVDFVHNFGMDKTLVICPSNITDTWVREFKTHCIDGTIPVVLDGTPAKNLEKLANCKDSEEKCVIVVSYSRAWRKPLSEELLYFGFGVVILDECHRIKSPSSRISKFCARMPKYIPNRIGLTGTFMGDKPIDVYAQLKCLDPKVFGTSVERFRDEFLIMGGFMDKQVLGIKNKERFLKKIQEKTFFVATEDVLELPPAISISRTTALSGPAMAIYKKLKKEMVADVKGGNITISNVLSKVTALHMLVSGVVNIEGEDGILRQEIIDTTKMELFADVLVDLPEHEPLVVFAKYKHDILCIKEACKSTGRTVAELSGSANEFELWRTGGRQVLVCQIQSGAEGLDMTRAKYMVYYSMSHSLIQYEQSLARIRRPGQTRSVVYIKLVTKGTIDELIYKALESKKNVNESVMEYLCETA